MENKVEYIKLNFENIQKRIQKGAENCGRKFEEIKLITVTKAQPVDVVENAILAGAIHLGENYPLEAVEKIIQLKNHTEVEWHMIGHLQSRKCPIIAEHFDYFHSLDSLKLAKKLDEKLKYYDRVMPVLLEVNVSGEESKYGWQACTEEQLTQMFRDIEEIIKLDNIRLNGLMTMPPFSRDSEKVRPFFKRMSELLNILRNKFPEAGWKELSMGTSVDFETAIQEGATFVRVGTAIVGPREYPQKTER